MEWAMRMNSKGGQDVWGSGQHAVLGKRQSMGAHSAGGGDDAQCEIGAPSIKVGSKCSEDRDRSGGGGQ